MLVIVSGLPGSGKSSLVEVIAREFKLRVIFASGILQELMNKKMHEIKIENAGKGSGFWESSEGKKAIQQRLKDGSMDKALDDKLLEIINTQDNIIVDSRTMPWLSKKGIKIWVTAPEHVRVQRVAGRDHLNVMEVLNTMRERLIADQTIYQKLYGFEFGTDLKPYHLVIDNENLDRKETAHKAIQFIRWNEPKIQKGEKVLQTFYS